MDPPTMTKKKPDLVPPHGGWPSFGWQVVGGEVCKHPTNYPILVQIVDRRAQGLTVQAIADSLNDQGLTTRQGGTWTKQQVSRVLRAQEENDG